MGSYYKQQLNDWVATLDVKASKVLDIGGSQSPIKGRTKSWDVEDYKIVDLEEPHSDSPKPDIIQDMNEILGGDDYRSDWKKGTSKVPLTEYEETVDLIFMLGVMDYVINPNIAMENVERLLKTSGTAWIEFPFVYPIHNPVDDEGCRYSEGCIRRLAKQADLKIEEIIYKRPKSGNDLLLKFYAEDGMRAAQGVDHNVTGYIVRFTK